MLAPESAVPEMASEPSLRLSAAAGEVMTGLVTAAGAAVCCEFAAGDPFALEGGRLSCAQSAAREPLSGTDGCQVVGQGGLDWLRPGLTVKARLEAGSLILPFSSHAGCSRREASEIGGAQVNDGPVRRRRRVSAPLGIQPGSVLQSTRSDAGRFP